MNFQKLPITKQVEFDGHMMTVPLSTRYITRDELGYVEAWRKSPCKLSNHIGYVSNEDHEMPTSIGKFSTQTRIKPICLKIPAGG